MEMDELLDPAAETAVLAGVFQHGADAYYDVADMITADCFGYEVNQAFYQCFRSIFEKEKNPEIDQPTIFVAAEQLGLTKIIEKPAAKQTLRAICNMPVKLQNVRKMAAELRKLKIRKQLLALNDDVREQLINAPRGSALEHLLGIVENPIFDFVGTLTADQQGPHQIAIGLDDYLTNLEENPREIIGISSGYKYYDKAIGGGFRRKTVNLIGARPKVGKTQLCDNIGLHVSRQLQIPVLNLDTEMSEQDHWNRLLANLTGIELDDIETGGYTKLAANKAKIRSASTLLKSIPYDYASIAGQPFEETLSSIRRWISKRVGTDDNGKTKDCLILFDYLKLMSSETISNALQEFQVLGFMMTALHNFVVRYDVPCLAMLQLNRDGITKESTDSASGSDRIIWLCSNFSIFKPKSDDEQADDGEAGGNRKLIPIACRHGRGLADGDYINMLFEGNFARVKELGLRSQMRKHDPKTGFEIEDDGSDIPFE